MNDVAFGLMYIAMVVGGLGFLMGVFALIGELFLWKSPTFIRFCEWLLGINMSEEPPISENNVINRLK